MLFVLQVALQSKPEVTVITYTNATRAYFYENIVGGLMKNYSEQIASLKDYISETLPSL